MLIILVHVKTLLSTVEAAHRKWWGRNTDTEHPEIEFEAAIETKERKEDMVKVFANVSADQAAGAGPWKQSSGKDEARFDSHFSETYSMYHLP